MARFPRVYIEGAVYYITCRGAFNEKLFKDQKDYAMYVELLEKYREEYNFKLFAYVLLPAHLHLLIEPDRKNPISDIMHSLNTAYSKYFNSKYKRRGHLFRERFKACLVEKDIYLGNIIHYIHHNPLRLNLVTTPLDYPYSSFYLYNNPTLSEIKEGIEYLKKYRTMALEKEKETELRKYLHRGGIFGSKEFREKVKEEIRKEREDAKKESHPKNYIGRGLSLLSLLIVGVGLAYFYFKFKVNVKDISIENKNVSEQGKFYIGSIEDLKNTEWVVRMTYANGEKSFPDTLSFTKGKFISAWFYQEGFKPTNYSIMQEREKIIWETIQTKGNSTLSWRGEVKGNKMQGIASLRQEGKAPQDFSFISVSLRRKK